MKQHVVNKAQRAILNQVIGQHKSLLVVVLLGFIGSLSGCKKTTDDVTPQTTTATVNENTTVDSWILANMRDLYYWNDKIPANPDTTLAPDVFFDSILNKYNATTNPTGDFIGKLRAFRMVQRIPHVPCDTKNKFRISALQTSDKIRIGHLF